MKYLFKHDSVAPSLQAYLISDGRDNRDGFACGNLLNVICHLILYVQVETSGNPGILFKTHPNINKELFSKENILGLKDPNRPFPANQSGDGVNLLKWRMQSADESILPLTSKHRDIWLFLSTSLFFHLLQFNHV